MKKYRSFILYLFFGIGTTIVNIMIYYYCSHIISLKTVSSTCIAWICAVMFAYLTNRIWVFESNSRGSTEIISEMVKFFSCRVITGVIDIVIMYIFVDIINLNDVLIKVLSNILVIVLNYVASKLIIFKNT